MTGTEHKQARQAQIGRIHQSTHWYRDPDSDAFLADLPGGLRGHIFNVAPGKWEWWVSKALTGAVLSADATNDVHSAQRAAVAAALYATHSGASAGLQ